MEWLVGGVVGRWSGWEVEWLVGGRTQHRGVV